MECQIYYRIFPELHLWVEHYSGTVSVEEIINQRKRVVEAPNYQAEYNAIADFREAILPFKLSELRKFIELLRENVSMRGNRKVGILTNTPQQVAISELYRLNVGELPMKVEIFSTVEAASRFIGHGDSIKEVQEILRRLREKGETSEISSQD